MLSDADGERDEVAEVSPSEASPNDKEAKSRAIAPKLTRSETAVTSEPAKTETTQAKPEKKAGHSAHAPSQQMVQHSPQVMAQPVVYQPALQPALQPMMMVNHPQPAHHHHDDHHYHHHQA